MNRPVFLIGGAPKIYVDAVRYLSVHATGSTVMALASHLRNQVPLQLLLSKQQDVKTDNIWHYETRLDLDQAIDRYLKTETEAVLFLSAAVNDYELERVSVDGHDVITDVESALPKITSGSESVQIHLRPAPKLISSLRKRGHKGPLVACKYESKETVIASAERLLKREQLDAVLANSLCGSVQAIVSADSATRYNSRSDVLAALAQRLLQLATDI